MLPFLKPKNISSVIMTKIKPEGGIEPVNEEGEPAPEMMAVAEELISAVHSKDAKALAEVLSALMCMNDMDEVEE